MTDNVVPNDDRSRSCVPFYELGAQVHMSLKISKDGLSREEDVEVLTGLYDELKPYRGGQLIVEEQLAQREARGNPEGL